jgi:hypothetical protein
MIKVSFRTSTAVTRLYVSPLRGIAIVSFKCGRTYSYKNVSRRAILNLLANPSISLGFWINTNLVNSKRTAYNMRAQFITA